MSVIRVINLQNLHQKSLLENIVIYTFPNSAQRDEWEYTIFTVFFKSLFFSLKSH